MQRFNRILVALNLSAADATVLRYANLVAHLAHPARVDVVNVINMTRVPQSLVAEEPTLLDAATDNDRRAVSAAVNEHLQPPAPCQVRTVVLRGNPVEELVRRARVTSTDLVVVGREPEKDRAGTLPERLSRLAPCSVLIVPRGAEPAIRSILVPVDFSSPAAAAMKGAVALGKAAGVAMVSCLHVFDVSANYQRFGKSYEEFSEILQRSALTASQRFVAPIDLRGLRLEWLVRQAAVPSKVIEDEVTASGFDCVVMGARGSSAARNVMLGAVSQRVINATQVPLLIVKSKRESTGILRTLLGVFRGS